MSVPNQAVFTSCREAFTDNVESSVHPENTTLFVDAPETFYHHPNLKESVENLNIGNEENSKRNESFFI